MSRRTRIGLGLCALAAVIVAAVAVLSFGGDGRPSTIPVRAAGDPSASQEEMATDAASAPAGATVPWMGGVTWDLADGLPALDGEAPAYRLGTADDDAVLALAAALGADGEITTEAGIRGVPGGDGRLLQVFEGPGAPWNFMADAGGVAVDSSTSSGAGVSGSAGEESAPVITEESELSEPREGGDDLPLLPDPAQPARPADLPTADEARAIALDVAAASGIDVDAATVAVDDGVTEWVVRIDPVVDGLPTWGMTTYVAVGGAGDITWANGHLGVAERGDDYPLVGTAVAADRLGEPLPGQPMPMIGGDAVASDDVAVGVEEPSCMLPEGCGVPGSDGAGATPAGPPCDPELGPDGDAATRDRCPEATTVPACDPATGPDGDPATEDGCVPVCAPDDAECVEPAPVPACDPATGPDGDPRTDDGCPEPQPVPEPLPEPEPIVMHVTDVRLGLIMLPDLDGLGGWLVPAYLWDATTDAVEETVVHPTIAIDEGFLAGTGAETEE